MWVASAAAAAHRTLTEKSLSILALYAALPCGRWQRGGGRACAPSSKGGAADGGTNDAGVEDLAAGVWRGRGAAREGSGCSPCGTLCMQQAVPPASTTHAHCRTAFLGSSCSSPAWACAPGILGCYCGRQVSRHSWFLVPVIIVMMTPGELLTNVTCVHRAFQALTRVLLRTPPLLTQCQGQGASEATRVVTETRVGLTPPPRYSAHHLLLH